MRLKEILLITWALLLITSCSTTEKFSVHVPAGTKIYTPDNTVTPIGIATNSDKVDVNITSDMYCGYILAQSAGSDRKIPIGLDYKIKRHTGTKVAATTGFMIFSMGVGATLTGVTGLAMAESDGDSDMSSSMGKIAAAGGAALLAGGGIYGSANECLQQTSYDYNFGYEKTQRVNMPALSFTLLKPNAPKGYEKVSTEKKAPSTSRKKASSGKDVTPEITSSSKVSKSRSDYSRKIKGEYKGSGTLFLGENIDEKYPEIDVIMERIDKTHVSVRIIESDEDYFDAPLVYEIRSNKKGGYDLNIDKLPEAIIQITKSGKLTFKHPKVNIDNVIYTLEIIAEKSKE